MLGRTFFYSSSAGGAFAPGRFDLKACRRPTQSRVTEHTGEGLPSFKLRTEGTSYLTGRVGRVQLGTSPATSSWGSRPSFFLLFNLLIYLSNSCTAEFLCGVWPRTRA